VKQNIPAKLKKTTAGLAPPPQERRNNHILIRGARVHNLKNIDLDLPRNRLIVVTGVSGSGKSSLAFDTIYAEGQRRYVESLSSYARQFLERMGKPDVDSISGISPAMAIEQKTNTRNPRSTVATSTEVYDYLRLLFSRVGKTHCRQCGRVVMRDSARTVIHALQEEIERQPAMGGALPILKLYITFPLPIHSGQTVQRALTDMQKEGFFRIILNGEIVDLSKSMPGGKLRKESVEVLVDRATYRPGDDHARLADSIETAFACGGGRATVTDFVSGWKRQFNKNFDCADCGIAYEEPDARLFSFNSPIGACPECQGFGRAMGIDMDLVVPDKRRMLREGAIQPWTTPKFRETQVALLRIAERAGVRTDVPFSELAQEERDVLMNGFEDFEGVRGFFKRVEKKSYKIFYRVLLSRYRGFTDCPLCGGSRLRTEALNVRVMGKRIPDITRMTVTEARQFFGSIALTSADLEIARRILDELRKRLSYLDDVGIGYLSLDRLSNTLSGGESQRINLATSLGSSLVGALYVLDEPSIGLHPRDNERLIRIMKSLRDIGNTVLVVEHDADMIRSSDVVVDLGPGAGETGGNVMFAGPPTDLASDGRSMTGKYLSGSLRIPIPPRRTGNGKTIFIKGASEHNLKGIDVTVPLNMMVCVTGVSGSGKSSLVQDVLFEGLRRKKGDFRGKEGAFHSLEGDQHIDAVESVDQSPIGRTPRSNPVTYIQAFDQIRAIFAGTQTSKVHGLKPGHFSFNVPGGRCEACEGGGIIKVEMQFMADLYLTCDACKGRRFQQEVLDVRWNGRNIDDVLGMTVEESIGFFGSRREGQRVAQRLKVLETVGLGYVRLGQAATSLSGGEAQRVKLAYHLSGNHSGRRTLFLFDEPTTGLHFDDIAKLIRCFQSLIDAGNSVLIIEHNPEVIKCADHVIDMGPEAGDKGGGIVAAGTPEEVARHPLSHTGRHLRPYLSLS